MNTDDTDFGEAGGEDGGGDVEFVPMPGGYGFERVRLRIEPGLSGQQRSVQTTVVPEEKTAPPRAAVPHEHAEPYANLGWAKISLAHQAKKGQNDGL